MLCWQKECLKKLVALVLSDPMQTWCPARAAACPSSHPAATLAHPAARDLTGPGLTWPCCPLQVGTPERPLSDLGVVSYRGYWTRVLLKVGQGLGLQQGATLLASAV